MLCYKRIQCKVSGGHPQADAARRIDQFIENALFDAEAFIKVRCGFYLLISPELAIFKIQPINV